MGLIHRDLKPANIFAAYRGGQYDVAKLLDFGLVKPTRDEDSPVADARRHGDRLAPLHGARADHADASGRTPRTDIYAMGAIAYFLLTGQPPFVSSDAMEVMMAHARDPVVPPSQLPARSSRTTWRRSCSAAWRRSPAIAIRMRRSLANALASCADAGGLVGRARPPSGGRLTSRRSASSSGSPSRRAPRHLSTDGTVAEDASPRSSERSRCPDPGRPARSN